MSIAKEFKLYICKVKGYILKCDEKDCGWESLTMSYEDALKWHLSPCQECDSGMIIDDAELRVLKLEHALVLVCNAATQVLLENTE